MISSTSEYKGSQTKHNCTGYCKWHQPKRKGSLPTKDEDHEVPSMKPRWAIANSGGKNRSGM